LDFLLAKYNIVVEVCSRRLQPARINNRRGFQPRLSCEPGWLTCCYDNHSKVFWISRACPTPLEWNNSCCCQRFVIARKPTVLTPEAIAICKLKTIFPLPYCARFPSFCFSYKTIWKPGIYLDFLFSLL